MALNGAAAITLGGVGVVLFGIAWATRAPPVALATAEVRLARWQAQHRAHDVDPSTQPFVGGFLRVADALARPLARIGILPNAVTALTMWLALWVPVLAAPQRHWPLAAAAAILISALGDGLDGSIAALTDRSTAFGFVLDSVADRVADAAFVVALVLAGGIDWWGATAGATVGLFEYTRARASVAGYSGVGVVTVGERPTRVVAAVIGMLACGTAPRSAEFIGTATLVMVTAASLIGLVQLGVVLIRRPPDP